MAVRCQVSFLAAILQILAVYGAIRCALSFVHPLMLSKGRTGLYLLTNVLLSGLTFVGCLIAVRWNPTAIALSIIVTMLLYASVFLMIARRTLEIRIRPLLKTFAFPGLASLFMLILVSLLQGFISKIFASATTVIVCVTAGVVVYILIALYGSPDLAKAIWKVVGKHLLRSSEVGSTAAAPIPGQYVAEATHSSSEP